MESQHTNNKKNNKGYAQSTHMPDLINHPHLGKHPGGHEEKRVLLYPSDSLGNTAIFNHIFHRYNTLRRFRTTVTTHTSLANQTHHPHPYARSSSFVCREQVQRGNST
eukprot:295245_1